jgi:hypothetical protein
VDQLGRTHDPDLEHLLELLGHRSGTGDTLANLGERLLQQLP